MSNPTQREQVFFSYSHKDKKWLELFQATLKPLIRANQLSVWDDTKIKAGDIWRDEIKQALASAKVAVLLVTTNFLNSDFIAENELPPLLEGAQNDGLKILMVIVGYSLFDETELGRYQAVNDPSRPLASISAASREKEIIRICKEIKSAVLETDAEKGASTKVAQIDTQAEAVAQSEKEKHPQANRKKNILLWILISGLIIGISVFLFLYMFKLNHRQMPKEEIAASSNPPNTLTSQNSPSAAFSSPTPSISQVNSQVMEKQRGTINPQNKQGNISNGKLIGKWVLMGANGHVISYTFLPNGIGNENYCGSFRWNLKGNILTIIYPDGCEDPGKPYKESYRISIESDKLKMKNLPDGDEDELVKAGYK